MIFQLSPKLSVARDQPQTYRQTIPQTRPCNSKASITKSVMWVDLLKLRQYSICCSQCRHSIWCVHS